MIADEDDRIAVIGLAGRFPGAPDAAAYWANLTAGEVSLSRLTDEGLRRAGVPESSIQDPSYVKYAPCWRTRATSTHASSGSPRARPS